jgi:hypothetical protein
MKKLALILIVVAPLFLILIYPRAYVVRGDGGGVLFWNSESAIMFMAQQEQGAIMNHGRYIAEPLLSGLGDVRPPNSDRREIEVRPGFVISDSQILLLLSMATGKVTFRLRTAFSTFIGSCSNENSGVFRHDERLRSGNRGRSRLDG